MTSAFPLTMAPIGQRLQVVSLAAGERATRRLLNMGLVPGAEVSIIQAQGNGAMMIVIGDTRLAIERGIAHKVLVEPVRCSPHMETPRTHEQEVSSWNAA